MLQKEIPAGFSEQTVKYGPYGPSRLIAGRCPQRFFGQYVRKDHVVGSSVNAARGSVIHAVCAKISQRRVESKNFGSQDVEQWVAEALGKYPAAYDQIDLVRAAVASYVGNPNPYLNSTTRCEASLGVKLLMDRPLNPNEVPRRLWMAAPYQADGKPDPSTFFGGTIDEVSYDPLTKFVTITERKTTPTAAKNEDHVFQQGCYAWLVKKYMPHATPRSVIHFAHPGLNFYSSPTIWTDEDLMDVEQSILSRVHALESFQDFPALPGKSCDYCHMTHQCPEALRLEEQRAKGAMNMNVNSVDDLKRLTEQLHVSQKLTDDLKGVIKDGMEKLGVQSTGVAIEGVWYGIKASENSVDWDATSIRVWERQQYAVDRLQNGGDSISAEERGRLEVMAKVANLDQLLTTYGVDPQQFKSWQGQKLKNLWKADKPALMDILNQEYLVKEKSTRFAKHKL